MAVLDEDAARGGDFMGLAAGEGGKTATALLFVTRARTFVEQSCA